MEKNWHDFKILHSNINGARAEFENACETLFRKYYSNENVQKVEVKKGDGGIDIFIGNYGIEPITVIQCKFFLDEIGDTQRTQIKKSFNRAKNSLDYELKEWILCVPRVFNQEEHKWFSKWKNEKENEFRLDEKFIKLKNGNELIDLMKQYDLYNRIFKIDELILANDTNNKVNEIHRIVKKQESSILKTKPEIYKDNTQASKSLWDLLEDKYTLNSETMSINFRGILFHSEHGISDFSKLLGIEIDEFEQYINGEKLPSIEIIYRLSKIAGLEMKFFFTPNFYGSNYLIQSDLIRYSILKNIKPEISINKIKNVNAFIGSVLYEVANKIIYLSDIIFDKRNIWNEYPKDLSEKFKGELRHQYYKLLEQIPNEKFEDNHVFDGFTKVEKVIQRLNCRILIETIKEIHVSEDCKPLLITYFDDEIKNNRILGRTYDEKNLRMVFSDEKDK